jgi:transcriptional regulator GlxA family with amidase domain
VASKKVKLYNTANYLLNNAQFLPALAIQDGENEIIHAVLDIFSSINNSITHHNPNKYVTTIKRALDYIELRDCRDISIPDLAKHSCSSIRNLEYGFNSILGLSPKQYMITRRLHSIKDELINQSETSIKDVLNNYGVINHGRFSKDFYSLFGIYPKELKLI